MHLIQQCKKKECQKRKNARKERMPEKKECQKRKNARKERMKEWEHPAPRFR